MGRGGGDSLLHHVLNKYTQYVNNFFLICENFCQLNIHKQEFQIDLPLACFSKHRTTPMVSMLPKILTNLFHFFFLLLFFLLSLHLLQHLLLHYLHKQTHTPHITTWNVSIATAQVTQGWWRFGIRTYNHLVSDPVHLQHQTGNEARIQGLPWSPLQAMWRQFPYLFFTVFSAG